MPRLRKDAQESAPKSKSYSLKSPNSRVKIPARSLQDQKRLYVDQIDVKKRLSLCYRKGKSGGQWIARIHTGGTNYAFHPLGLADDYSAQVSQHALSYDEAQVKAREWATLKEQQDAGELVAGPYTVADAIQDYLKNLVKEKRKPQYSTTAIAKAHILPTLGDISLEKLTHRTVKSWRDALAEAAPRIRTKKGEEQRYREIDPEDPQQMRRRQATANRVLTILKAALNYAKSDLRRVSTDNAWVDVKPFAKVDVAKIRFLTNEEVTELVRHCEPSFQTLVKGALLTGCRYGELARMTVADFDEEKGQLFVAESKNGESRYVDLNDTGISFFASIAASRNGAEPLFLRNGWKEWKTSDQFRPMNEACKAAKVAGVTFHILRHTYASHSLMAGMTIEVLAQQLGHKDTRITMRHYAHLCPTFKRESIRKNAPSFGFGSPQDAPEADGKGKGPQLVQRAS